MQQLPGLLAAPGGGLVHELFVVIEPDMVRISELLVNFFFVQCFTKVNIIMKYCLPVLVIVTFSKCWAMNYLNDPEVSIICVLFT